MAKGIIKFLVDPAKAGQDVVEQPGEPLTIEKNLTIVRKLDLN